MNPVFLKPKMAQSSFNAFVLISFASTGFCVRVSVFTLDEP